MGRRASIAIFGNDYPTRDGTCIRDYVHVTDIATAHILAIEQLAAGSPSGRFNLGSGKGYSVLEIIEAARKVTGHPIPAEVKARRAGDPAALVASSKEAEEVLGWKRKYESSEEIVASAWRFHQSHPKGYGDRGTTNGHKH
jgi:UDP-glucose 4-epimerase